MCAFHRAALLILAIAFLNCFSPTLRAQPPVDLYGRSATPEQHLRDVLNGAFWSERVTALDDARASLQPSQEAFVRECAADYVTWRQPQSATEPSERLEAIQEYQSCLENIRANLIAVAQDDAPVINASMRPEMTVLEREAIEASNDNQFLGLSFGLGVGVSFSDDDRISAAEVGADGNIRALSTETQEPRVILESHYYGWCKAAKCKEGDRGIGPFFGIVAKDDKLISAFAVGIMFGWKMKDKDKHEGFSIGIGAMLDSDVSSLADGFEEGRPLPDGEAAPVFAKESRWGSILFFTRTF